MDKISTSELIAKISASTGQSQRVVKAVVADIAKHIDGYVANGQAVSVTGLGKFYPRDRKARTMVCPMNGKETEVAAKRVLSFKASKTNK